VWGLGLVATACVAAVCYWLAQPVPGVGIALPTFVPAITAAIAAWVLSRRYAAPLTYTGGRRPVPAGTHGTAAQQARMSVIRAHSARTRATAPARPFREYEQG